MNHAHETYWLTPHNIEVLHNAIIKNHKTLTPEDKELLAGIEYELVVAPTRFARKNYSRGIRETLGFTNGEVPIRITQEEMECLAKHVPIAYTNMFERDNTHGHTGNRSTD